MGVREETLNNLAVALDKAASVPYVAKASSIRLCDYDFDDGSGDWLVEILLREEPCYLISLPDSSVRVETDPAAIIEAFAAHIA